MTGDDTFRSQRLEIVEALQPCIALCRSMFAEEGEDTVVQQLTCDQRASAWLPESRCVDVIALHRPEDLDLVALKPYVIDAQRRRNNAARWSFGTRSLAFGQAIELQRN